MFVIWLQGRTLCTDVIFRRYMTRQRILFLSSKDGNSLKLDVRKLFRPRLICHDPKYLSEMPKIRHHSLYISISSVRKEIS